MRILLPLLLSWVVAANCAFAADDISKDGGFESPQVGGRMPLEKGGDPSHKGAGPGWVSFRFLATGTNGQVTGGLTNEVARSGKQSLFIRFDHVNRAYQSAVLVSNFIPVAPGATYFVGIWGRTDANDLINSEGRSAYLKLQVDFYAKDANESVGETFYAVQPLPGSKGHQVLFKPDDWSLFAKKLVTPSDAVFAQITWRWETGSDPGEVSGIMYFDDAAMLGPKARKPDMTPAPVQQPAQ